MALESKVTQEQEAPSQERLSQEEDRELDIMVLLAKNLIDDGGFEVIEQAEGSKDPGVVIGQFIMQLGSQLAEQLPFEPSPRVMLAVGGWVEQISDFLQEEYDVPKKVMDRAEIYVASSAQQMAQQQAPAQPGAAPQPQQAPPAGPAMPQGAI